MTEAGKGKKKTNENNESLHYIIVEKVNFPCTKTNKKKNFDQFGLKIARRLENGCFTDGCSSGKKPCFL